MKLSELRSELKSEGFSRYSNLYADLPAESARLLGAVDSFADRFGADRDASIFSVPGRTEISGNHTDHNRGCVLAGAIDRDIIAVASKNDDGVIRFHSVGHAESIISLDKIDDPDAFENYSSASLVAGLTGAFKKNGYKIGGFDAWSNTEVLKGSGISSSAAFEVMIGNILNYFYNDGKVDNKEIAKFAQYAENVYFGKPCGLMDQMACAVGGFVAIDFADPKDPIVEPIDFALSSAGYSLCIVNTGGNHADLNEDYASVPAEMKGVAKLFGKEVLRGLTEEELLGRAKEIRETLGDRALLRAIHFIRENERVARAKDALKRGDISAFFDEIRASGNSSFKYLQNVYTVKNVSEQGLSLALAAAEGFLAGKDGASRVHGGGFAGTIQVFLKNEDVDGFCALMNGIFGEGAAMRLRIRPVGATKLL